MPVLYINCQSPVAPAGDLALGFNADSIMPSYYRTYGLRRVDPAYLGKTILSKQDIEDVFKKERIIDISKGIDEKKDGLDKIVSEIDTLEQQLEEFRAYGNQITEKKYLSKSFFDSNLLCFFFQRY